MRTLAMLLAVLCAAVVALAVFVLRALDARGVDLAGALLDAMHAPRPARRVRVTVATTFAAAPGSSTTRPPPLNRRRIRALDDSTPGPWCQCQGGVRG